MHDNGASTGAQTGGLRAGGLRGERRGALLLFAAVVALGAGITWQTARLAERDMRAHLLMEARMVAQGVDAGLVRNLSGSEADLTHPDYQRLKAQLTRVCTANPACRFIYLTGRRPDGTIFFLVDSEPPDSRDHSPPGQSYDEAQDSFVAVFTSGQPASEGRVADRWGAWVSGLVPIRAPGTRRVMAVLGMDIDARYWTRSIAERCIAPLSVTALILLLLSLFVLIHNRTAREAQHQAVSATALRESREQLQTILDTVQTGVIIIEAETRTITDANPAALALIGAPRETVIGQVCHQFICPADQGRCPVMDLGQTVDCSERRLLTAGGRTIPILKTVSPLTLDGRKHLIESFVDVSALKQKEAELRRSEDLLNEVGALAAVGGWELDVSTGHVRWTRETYRIHEVPEGTPIDLSNAIRFYDAPARDTLAAAIKRAIETGESFDLEMPFTSAKGRPLWTHAMGRAVTAHGTVVQITGTFQDITGRRQVEEELRASREKFRSIVDNIGIGVALISPRLEILELNRQMRAWFPGAEPGSGVLCHARFRSPPRSEPCTHCPTIGTLADGLVHEALAEASDGTCARRFRIVSSPIMNSEGQVTAAIEMVDDITERTEMAAQLHQQQKLASVGTLARGMAHEINNPIMGIMNYAQLVKDAARGQPPLAEFAEEIIAEGHRIARMTHSLLSFTQQQDAPPLAPAAMRDVAASVLPLVAKTARDGGIDLSSDIPAGLPPIACRRAQIGYVMMALLRNALEAQGAHAAGDAATRPRADGAPSDHTDAGPTGGGASRAIRLSARRFDGPGQSRVRLTVDDNGAGIPAGIRSRVFDPFFTTKDRTRHSGLGLWISRSIVQEHGGELSIESEAGLWTRVHVDLPIPISEKAL